MLYDVKITTDRWGWRIVPSPPSSSARHFAAFLGCSYTWGEGVNDNETLPYYFAQAEPNYHAYNMGFSGYGPNSLVVRLEAAGPDIGVREPTGIGIYIFMPDHLVRVLGTMNFVTNGWGQLDPYFTEGKGGHLERRGSFESGRPYLFRFWQFLSKREFIKFFHLDFPRIDSDYSLGFFTKVLMRLRADFRARFPRSEFVVVLWPDPNGITEDLLIPYLEKSEIRYLDYSKFRLDRLIEGQPYLPDGHPSKFTYGVIGRQIADDLKRSQILP